MRKHLVFAHHNLIQDPPFTKINLVSCRNVLIYFQVQSQLTTLAALNFSLEIGGIMFLGASEALGELSNSFQPLERTWRIFRKVEEDRTVLARARKLRRDNSTSMRVSQLAKPESPSDLKAVALLEIYETLLKTKVPLGVLLDNKQKIIYSFGDTTDILRGGSGRFTGSITAFLPPTPRTTIMAALIRAQKEPEKTVMVEGLKMNPASDELYNVSVLSLQGNLIGNVGWVLQFEGSSGNLVAVGLNAGIFVPFGDE